MNAAPWAPGTSAAPSAASSAASPAAPVPNPAAAARAVSLDAPGFAPVAGVLEAILRTGPACRITLLSPGGGRLPLLAAGGALLAVEGAEGPPAESGKARAARLAAVLGGFCAGAATGGALRALVEPAETPSRALPVPPEDLAALVPVLPEPEPEPEPGARPSPEAAEAREGAGPCPAERPGAPTGAAPQASPNDGPDTVAGPVAHPGPEPVAGSDPLAEALLRALGDGRAVAAALPGLAMAWVGARGEGGALTGPLALCRQGIDRGSEPSVRPDVSLAAAGERLDRWLGHRPGVGSAPEQAAGEAAGEAAGTAAGEGFAEAAP